MTNQREHQAVRQESNAEERQMTNQSETIDVEELVSLLERKLARHSPILATSSIFRVPTVFRKCPPLCNNTDLFDPTLVSIGPYYRNEPKLQPMQKIKLWYLQSLIDRAPTPQTSLQCFTKRIMDKVDDCRKCYAEEVVMNNKEFVELMVIDGCFLVEFFRKAECFRDPECLKEDPLKNDPLFKTSWMRKTLITDLLLLENQLPWFVLDCLFKLTNDNDDGLSLPQLAHNFFYWDTLRFKPIMVDSSMKAKHLLDLQRNIILSGHENVAPTKRFRSTPCVTALLQAGVRFEVGKTNDLTKIEFDKGVLRIPPINIIDNAESLFRNLIAYEQCDRGLGDTVSCYGGFLDNLIDSVEDLDYLRKKGIVTYFLSTEDVSGFFNRLYNEAHIEKYTYEEVAEKINDYCLSRWQRWRAVLMIFRRKYFSSPWSFISLFAAIVIIVLTFLQTLYTII